MVRLDRLLIQTRRPVDLYDVGTNGAMFKTKTRDSLKWPLDAHQPNFEQNKLDDTYTYVCEIGEGR